MGSDTVRGKTEPFEWSSLNCAVPGSSDTSDFSRPMGGDEGSANEAAPKRKRNDNATTIQGFLLPHQKAIVKNQPAILSRSGPHLPMLSPMPQIP
ncbi:unnamed protein product [Lampetra planeri]